MEITIHKEGCLPLSPEKEALLISIAKKLAGREFFPESNARARELVKNLHSLPKPKAQQ